ncbi:MAG: phosphatidate cytidylyltransferase [Pseudomonadota bacterium]
MMSSGLNLRVISSAVLLPITLLVLVIGGWTFKIFVGIAFGIAVKEWVRMAVKVKHPLVATILGVLYLMIGFVAFIELRTEFDQGLFFALTLMLGVWASDIAAYFTGKTIGGPKLAPKISPNKTWAGFIGGTLGSALMLLALDYYVPMHSGKMGLEVLPFAPLEMAFIIGALFTVFGQIGDLGMSCMKRKVDVKDTGTLIPGHGGLLDRIDSLLLVTPFFFIVLTILAN